MPIRSIRAKLALPIQPGTTSVQCGTSAEFNATLGSAPGTSRRLIVEPGQKVDF